MNRCIHISSPVPCCIGYHYLQNQESVQIILDSLKHLQQSDNLKIYAYVILENYLWYE